MVWRKSCSRRSITNRCRDCCSRILYADTCLLDDRSYGIGHYPKSFASLRRIEEILQAEIEIEEETIKTVAEPTFDQTNAAAFEHVTFKYTEISDPVLEDIDFTIPKGKTTAIVGGTGSGKSSLAKLLLRLSDPTIGKVTLGGIPLTQMTQEQIRSHISYVPQKAFLFSGTILSNLQMGNEYASTEELSKAIKIAQLEELVDTLPDGLDSFVAQGGSNYSGARNSGYVLLER